MVGNTPAAVRSFAVLEISVWSTKKVWIFFSFLVFESWWGCQAACMLLQCRVSCLAQQLHLLLAGLLTVSSLFWRWIRELDSAGVRLDLWDGINLRLCISVKYLWI